MLTDGMEEYYQRVIKLQEKLRQSEEDRLKLEMKFNEMLQTMKEEEEVHFKKLRTKYKKFLEEDRRRQQRNDKILEALDRIENRTAVWEVKTEKFKHFRRKYQDYFKNASGKYNIPPSKGADRVYQDDYPDTMPDFSEKMEYSGKIPDDDIMERYIQSVSSQKCKEDVLQNRPPENKYSNLGNINSSAYWRNSKDLEKMDLEKDTTEIKNKKDLNNALKQNITAPIVFGKGDSYLLSTDTMIKPSNFDDVYSIDRKPSVEYKAPYIDGKLQDEGSLIQIKMSAPQDQYELKTIPIESFGQDSARIATNLHQNQKQDNPEKVEYNFSEPIVRDQVKIERREDPMNTNQKFVKNSKILESNHFLIFERESEAQNRASNLAETHQEVKETAHSLQKTFEVSRNVQTPQQIETVRKIQTYQTGIEEDYKTTTPKAVFPENTDNSNVFKQVSPNLTEHGSAQEIDAKTQEEFEPPLDDLIKPTLDNIDINPNVAQSTEESAQIILDESNKPQIVEDVPIHEEVHNETLLQEANSEQYDANGQYYYDQDPQQYQGNEQGQYEETPQELGQYYDENGQPLQQYYDDNGQPLPQYDENGQPVGQYSDVQYDPNYDVNAHQYNYDENGQPIYDQSQALPQYDENGQLLQTYYDENGQAVQYYGEGQSGEQYDENGQIIQESQQYYQEQITDVGYGQELQPEEGVKEEQGVGQEVPKMQESHHVEDKPEEKLDQDGEEVQEEFKGIVASQKASNVLDILDTDTESAKQDTKVSNDSDFDYSNG